MAQIQDEIDALMKQGKIAEASEVLRRFYRFASEKDFEDPFYVVVHEHQIDVEMNAGSLPRDIGLKVKEEIAGLKARHDWTEGERFTLATGVPRDRPVLVCGALGEVCVSSQYWLLRHANPEYDAYISKEGVLSISSLRKPPYV